MKRLSSTPSRNGKARSLVRRRDAEGLVGEEERCDRPLPAAEVELTPERDAVEEMPDVEQERRQDDARPGRPRREQPDGGELGAAGEDEERERLRLDERQPCAAGGDRIGERKGNDAEPERHHREEAPSERAVVSLRAHPIDRSDPAHRDVARSGRQSRVTRFSVTRRRRNDR